MGHHRKFTVTFKQQVVEEVLSGRFSAAHIARKYDLTSGTVSTWIQKYQLGYFGAVLDSVENDPAHLRAKIAELERMVGKLAVENDALKKTARMSIPGRSEPSSVISGLDSVPSVAPVKSSGSPEARTTTKLRRKLNLKNRNRSNYALTSKR